MCGRSAAGGQHDFWRYDALTDEHALDERQAMQFAGERADQAEQGS
jgi:hypothetical protein